MLDAAFEHLARIAHDHALRHPDGGEGLCLPVAAALGYVLRERHGVLATAVCGTYDAQAHWWLDTNEVRIDPTRHQFDGEPHLTHPIGTHPGYVAEESYPALWSREDVIAEAQRAFMLPSAAHAWVIPLLRALEAVPSAEPATA